jgi:putative intracellular protease/amidase
VGLHVKAEDGSYVVKNKKVTGFTGSEEEAVQLTSVVHFLLEDELIKRQASFVRGDDWGPFAQQDGLLISGQNHASSELTAQKLMLQINPD